MNGHLRKQNKLACPWPEDGEMGHTPPDMPIMPEIRRCDVLVSLLPSDPFLRRTAERSALRTISAKRVLDLSRLKNLHLVLVIRLQFF